jgi:sortase A
MKVMVNRHLLRRVLQWTQRVLFAAAIALLGYCAFVLVNTWWFQRVESRNLDHLLKHELPGEDERPSTTPPKAVPMPTATIGRIEIERLGLSAVIVEGTDAKSLRRAVGHIVGTALPGERGNVGVAGHRDTFFRPLRNIQRDDMITLSTPAGNYRYRVVSTRVVSPNDVAVLSPDGTEVLTLVTCYPFYFVGSAPDRFIVRAKRVKG